MCQFYGPGVVIDYRKKGRLNARLAGLAAVALWLMAPVSAATLDELYKDISNPFSQGVGSDRLAGISVSISIEGQHFDSSSFDTFELAVASGEVTIRANTRAAALYAADQLARLKEANPDSIPDGVWREQAALEVRALHLVMRRMTPDRLRGLIDKARQARFNMLLLYVGDDVAFEAAGLQPLRRAMSKQDFQAVVEYARASGMIVVPHLPLLTKQHRFFKQDYPELMYNNATYDPANPETMQRVYAHLEELIELIRPVAIHIGHDEVEGSFRRPRRWNWTEGQKRKWLGPDEKMLPADLYQQHIEDVHEFLARHSIQTWIWGDMLLRYDEIAGVTKANSPLREGFVRLRDKLPRDIVICDWNYKHPGPNCQSVQVFAELGYQVLGASREKPDNIAAFSRYMAGAGDAGRGMIATLWSLVNKAEPQLIDDVISRSGREFWSPAAVNN